MRPVRPWVPLAAAALASALLLAAPSQSQSPPSASVAASAPPTRLSTTTTRAIEKLVATISQYGGKLGVSVIELESGQPLAAVHEQDPLNPASNMKLLTAAAALWHLSGSHQYRTALYGKRTGATVEQLVVRGNGDPSLRTSDLWAMAAELHRSGVRKVQGDILVDQSFFDESWLAPGFDQQPNEWAYFRAPISAVSLERNALTMSVWPTNKDQPAAVGFDPPGWVDVSGSVKTGPTGSAQNITLILAPNGPRLTAKIGGAIADSSHPMTFPKRVENPSLLVGFTLRALLAEQGIALSGGVRAGGEKARNVLVLHRSRPLAELLQELGKHSDNFFAETIFKSLAGKDKGRELSSADGAEVVTSYLKAIHALDEGTVIKNGSGLYDTNRITPSTITRVLRAAWLDPAMSSEYVAHLAIGGVDGTLHGRFEGLKKTRALRAKTGTLSDVSSLSGYILAPSGRPSIAFSIVVNNVAGKVTGSRAAIDRCVAAIARALLRTKAAGAGTHDDDE
jgi:serine-type D-Ala-D-Ala carboxypeptidase/endopeptidase (penicillin-binding protein 4)